MKRRAVFVDRDGVINECVDRGDVFEGKLEKVRWTAPHCYEEFKMREGVREALGALAGFLRVLVTNQPDIGYGLLRPGDHDQIMAEVKALPLDDIFICFHGRDAGCECKKPKPGMLLAAAEKWAISLPDSYIIGDTKSDLGAGRAAGCRVVLVDASYNQDLTADFRARDLADAAHWILEQG